MHAVNSAMATKDALNLCLFLKKKLVSNFFRSFEIILSCLDIRTSDCRSKRSLASGALKIFKWD